MLARGKAGLVGLAFIITEVVACAPMPAKIGTTEITSAEILRSYRDAESSAQDVRDAHYPEALSLAEEAVRISPDNAWAHYDRAIALHHLGRTDAAVGAYRSAELKFGDDRWGKSIAIYGRARALTDVGRCAEANVAYSEYAAFTRAYDPRAADLALSYARDCQPLQTPIGDPAMDQVVTAVMLGHDEDALTATDHVGPAARASGWFDYSRGAALAGLRRTDEALTAYRTAEARFGNADARGRALAVYGRARALDNAGRCSEAKATYREYADLVRATSPRDAEMASAYARQCGGP